MYTNIHLKHALPIIKYFLENTELGQIMILTSIEGINILALLATLGLVMDNTIFRFGDAYILKKQHCDGYASST